ncbi:UDP-N-acetylglucosamine 2-epimerase [uncultured archaeon]|nr:UDP-N-acetylglucosamine 2-epimerase [uncultured archaeon]
MKISIILGTRPEIIKLSPIIHECKKLNLDLFILHTGQHYSFDMDRVFFQQLELPLPNYNLNVGSGSHAEQTAKILIGVEKILHKEKPDIVLVEGDTNTVLAGALAAVKLHIKIGHVESGLRSYDYTMPEEINRILTDHCSDILFAPTNNSKQNLRYENIQANKIFITGNTIVDAVFKYKKIAAKKSNILKDLGVCHKEYFLVTVHRQENTDDINRLKRILKGLTQLHKKYNIPIVYPVHPRTQKKMKEFALTSERIKLVKPVDFFSFLQLEEHSRIVLTDSGGVQEETCILGTPCVTLRDNTERPETLRVGSNILAGTNPEKILDCVSIMDEKNKKWTNPYGSGDAGKKIVTIIKKVV